MSDRVTIEMVGQVAHVRLSRPDKMNALDAAMFDALAQAGATLEQQRGLRAVVLSGDGRGFCAGLDLQSFDHRPGDPFPIDLTTPVRGVANIVQHICLLWRQLPVPVIAAVQGVAFGGGLQLALGADMRFVHPDTKMSVMEVQWGLIPDMAGTLLMRGLIRPDVIAELSYSGRVFDGAEAERLGFVTRLCADPVADALAHAQAIAGRSPDAVRAIKRVLSIAEPALTDRILQAEAAEQMALVGSANQVEAVAAAMAKRPPRFIDPQG